MWVKCSDARSVFIQGGRGEHIIASTASAVTIVTHLRLVHQDKNRAPPHPTKHTPPLNTLHIQAWVLIKAHTDTYTHRRSKHNIIWKVHVTECSQCAGVHVKHHLGPAGASRPNKRIKQKRRGGERCQMVGVRTFKWFETGGFPTP